VPPLRNGEHLSRPEFESRWEAAPQVRFAELIEGIVFTPPPISETHSKHHDRLHYWLCHYAHETSGVTSRITPSLRLDNRNEFQPDCLLRIESPKLGRSQVSVDDYLEGAPELVAEIAVSSRDDDAHEKRRVYERVGVQEYLLWQVMDARLDWWSLRAGEYHELKPRKDGVQCSEVFPGLWLDVRALLSGNEAKVRATLQRGLNSTQHRQFVRRLAGTR
jgi:Uma2 family endonuclease